MAAMSFPLFKLLFGSNIHGVLNAIMENFDEGPSTCKREIQYAPALRPKIHILWQLTQENLL